MLKIDAPSKKLILRILINSALGVVLVFVWSRFVNLGEILKILKTVDLRWMGLFFFFFLFSTFFRGLRLKQLLKDYKLPLKDAIMLNLLSQFLSFAIPIRAGEVTKSVYLTSQFSLSLGKTIIWVFIDRFLDFWVILLLIAALLFWVPTNLPPNFVKAVLFVLSGFTLVSIMLVKSQSFSKKVVNFLAKFLIIKKVQKWFLTFTHAAIDGFEVLQRPPWELSKLVVFTVLAVLSDAFVWLSVFWAMGIKIDYFKGLLGNCLGALTFLVPSAPGYVGSAEAAGLAVFSGVLGIEANMASAALVFYHILTLVVLLVLGILSLYLLKFDMNLVWKKLRGQ